MEDISTIPTVNGSQPNPSEGPGLPREESQILGELQAEVRDQEDLERDVGIEATKLLFDKANDRDMQRMEKANTHKEKLLLQIRKTKDDIPVTRGLTARAKLHNDVTRMEGQVEELQQEISEIEEQIQQRQRDAANAVEEDGAAVGRLPNESQRDFLIRTGKITPFSKFGLTSHGESSNTLQGAILDAEDEQDGEQWDGGDDAAKFMSHQVLRRPGFATDTAESSATEEWEPDRPKKRRKVTKPVKKDPDDELQASEDEWRESSVAVDESGSLEEEDDDSDDMPATKAEQKRRKRKSKQDDEVEDLRGIDDGDERTYQARLHKWCERRICARRRAHDQNGSTNDEVDQDEEDDDLLMTEIYAPHPEIEDTVFDDEGTFRIPGDIYPSLFDYQKTGVKWLYELYTHQVGGIVGDEMGLGKTIQMIAHLAGLHYSKKITKPIIVVCPATVMKQWVNEFHRWWPPFRVTILHSSGTGMMNMKGESSRESLLEAQMYDASLIGKALTPAQRNARKVIAPVLENGGVLVTTYSGLQSYATLLIPVDWEYAILDEGHKIKNPDAAITIYCKELRTANRVILSGTPMQNNLLELWSLFDFIFPMRLGTLVDFKREFIIPIRLGGYANASRLAIETARQCAVTLHEAISPYLLQRIKKDVAADLPKKTEQVLFCKLTSMQRRDYENFLKSPDYDAIVSGKLNQLKGINIIRKICNHPDLQNHRTLKIRDQPGYGDPKWSGKMQVIGSLLPLWKETGHKTLLFAQQRIMLDILEKFVGTMPGMKYRRMDGTTPIPVRQTMVDEFNNNPDLHVFLLTTKVGGLGVNLTGADRVIIYDPDWNPATDLQARERAWRLGQKREVVIYRLMTAGTIEEKVYHRQLFKQFLTNKIMKDPEQRTNIKIDDMTELFKLGKEGETAETSTLFSNAEVNHSASLKRRDPNDTRNDKSTHAPRAAQHDITSPQDVAGIASIETFTELDPEAPQPADPSANPESKILSGIFSRSAVQGVDHDTIISGTSSKPQADARLVEQEARRVAALAAKELRRAGEIARTVPVGTPTWTGTFGVSGRPTETTPRNAFASRGRGGVASSALLGGALARTSNNNSSPVSRSNTPGRASTPGSASETTPSGKDFARLIRDFMQVHGGSCPSQMLVDHFDRYCRNNVRATAEFKESLKAIAVMEKGARGVGRAVWKLKGEYRRA
jgi:DNA excision repair protein ERCC-6